MNQSQLQQVLESAGYSTLSYKGSLAFTTDKPIGYIISGILHDLVSRNSKGPFNRLVACQVRDLIEIEKGLYCIPNMPYIKSEVPVVGLI